MRHSALPVSRTPGWLKAWSKRSRKTWASPFSSPVMWAADQSTNSWRRDLRSVGIDFNITYWRWKSKARRRGLNGVIPSDAGIQAAFALVLDPRLRGDDIG